jgi:hypothetical protein
MTAGSTVACPPPPPPPPHPTTPPPPPPTPKPSPSTPPPLHPTPAPLHPNLPQPAPAVDQVGNQLQLSWLPSDDGGCATLYNVEGFDPSGKRVLSSAVTTPNATAAGLLGLTKVRACTRLRLGQLACSLF